MEDQKKEKRTLKEDWILIRRGMKIWLEVCPQLLIWSCLNVIVSLSVPYFSLYLSAQLVNELAGACDPERLFMLAAVTVAGQFVINMAVRFLQGRVSVWQDVSWQMIELYTLKAMNHMPYEHLEDAEVTLLREKINAHTNATGAGMMQIYWAIPDIIGNGFNFGISLAVTISMFRMAADRELGAFLGFINSPLSGILFGVLLILNAFLSTKLMAAQTAKLVAVSDKVAKDNTLGFTLRDIFGEDVAIFDLKKVVLGEWKKRLLRPEWQEESVKARIRYQTLFRILQTVLECTVFIITAGKAFIGVFGIGNFLLYKGAVKRFADSVSDLAAQLSRVRENNTYLKDFFALLDLPDNRYHGTLAVEKRDDIDYEIEFRNVSFRYPRTQTYVLRNVNMKFRIGDKLAIVGENGSGKTTFIKLLCRLYDPTEGTILLNGIDITKYRYDEYIALFSVVFQDYMLFSFSLAANVTGAFEYDAKRVEECLAQAGLGEKLAGLDKGIETMLGRGYENEGIDLSGGEEQKVALARALYKDAPFVVLDEPTAALDPLAEAAVYESFRELTRDKTAVFISHRLSSCRFCDDIAVFEKGRLVQRGSHDRLAAEPGKYSELWEAQAKYYTKKAAT